MTFHPWRYLRDHHPDWTIIWAPLPAGLLGRTLHDLRVIVLDATLTQAGRRSTLAHELEHITRGPTPPVPALAAKEEAAIDRAVARRLIDIVRLGEALAWQDDWIRAEILGRTEAARIWPGRLPAPHLTRGAGPLWRRSLLELQAAERQLDGELTPRPRAKVVGARETGDQPLDIAGVAEHTGLSVATLRGYVRDKTMPKPDGTMGQSAWWWASTINVWQDARPTPGRPRKTEDA